MHLYFVIEDIPERDEYPTRGLRIPEKRTTELDMKRSLLAIVVAILFTSHSAIAMEETREPPPSKRVTLVYSGNLDGELEPCGCSETGNLGGILRRASKVMELRKERPNLFLISSGGLLANASPRDRLKSQYILKGLAELAYDAIGLQWRDLSYGTAFLDETPLPWTASNWKDDHFPHQRVIRHGTIDMAFFAWLTPEDSPFRQMKGTHQAVIDDPGPLRSALEEAKRKGKLTVLSTTLPLKKAKTLFDLEDVDILIIESAYEEYGKPLQEGETIVLQPGSRGMRLGRLELELDQRGNVLRWEHQVIPLPESVPDAPFLKSWYEEYNAKVKAAYLASVQKKKQLQAGKSPYVGADACIECHAAAYEVWRGTAHSTAFSRLEEVGKSFDPDCISCHTVGFDQPGGYIDSRLTMHLMDVQCESCHGPARKHAETKGKTSTPHADWPREKICMQCHTQPHSPEFRLDTYWPRVAH